MARMLKEAAVSVKEVFVKDEAPEPEFGEMPEPNEEEVEGLMMVMSALTTPTLGETFSSAVGPRPEQCQAMVMAAHVTLASTLKALAFQSLTILQKASIAPVEMVPGVTL